MNYNKFILFGDSITQYSNEIVDNFALQPSLQNLYIRKLDILNRGYSGYNSKHAKLILPKLLESEFNSTKDNIKLMTIFFGTNDAFENINSIQPVSLEEYKNNIEFLVKTVIGYGIKVILIGPGLHDPKLAVKEFTNSEKKNLGKDATTNKRLYQYSKAAKSVANDYDIPFIDLWEEFRKDGGWTKEQIFEVSGDLNEWQVGNFEAYLNDGIHYTPKAYKILFNGILEAIKTKYPHLLPENLPTKLSDWKEINPDNLESIFK
ncbi:IAH1 [Candida pseudojiufengensis]|uniref:IAH1 n=1 Tax=Candida pseudojiufengensis TaxID=497109 RepID=UPI002224AAFC|nr:IAH1 [Candida pseudojiufengensis]KAI5961830.1 IAH1 [Candida pseudojiufengensis]